MQFRELIGKDSEDLSHSHGFGLWEEEGAPRLYAEIPYAADQIQNLIAERQQCYKMRAHSKHI